MARWVKCKTRGVANDPLFINFDLVTKIKPHERGAQIMFGPDDFITVNNSVAELLENEDVRTA